MHQTEAIVSACNHFQNYDRGQLHMACGTGKTLTSLWIAQKMKAQKIVIILPSLQLQEQSLNIWLQEANYFNFELLAVGSDKTFSKKYNVTTTTIVDEIKFFLQKTGPRIVLSTYQSYERLLNACDESNFFDFGIVDEAHNTAGHNEKKFSRLLLGSEKIPIKKILFMTGTPKFFDGAAFVSMNNESFYGKVIYKLSTDEAIKQNILSDYKLLVMYISEHDLINEDNRNLPVLVNKKAFPLYYIALKIYVEKAIELYKLKKILSFHNSKARASKFATLLNSDLVKSYSINCSQNISKRIEIVNNFKQDNVSCICNPRIMIEGFDLPQIDSILFADIKNSKQDLTQAIGRALRKFPNKNISFILLPIFVDKNGIINKKDYATYSELLASVALSDGRIYNQFAFGTTETAMVEILPSKIFNNKELKHLYNSLSVRVWKKIKPTNYLSYVEFKQLIETEKITSLHQYSKYFDKTNGLVSNNKMIPKRPNRFYSKEWTSWFEIFGYQTEPILEYSDFKMQMAQFSLKYGINNSKKYFSWAYSNKNFGVDFPKNFPRYPSNFYKKWVSWYELFDNKKKEIINFAGFKEELMKVRHLFKANFEKEYILWSKGLLDTDVKFPENFPITPSKKYKEWEGWSKLFNKQKIVLIDYCTFKELLKFYQETYKINSCHKYFAWANRNAFLEVALPENFPKNPAGVYKKDWEGWPKVFGKTKLSYTEFKESLLYYISLYPINSGQDYLNWAKGKLDIKVSFPHNFPRYPNDVYKEWEGWNNIFGKEFLKYEEFRVMMGFFKKKYGINSAKKYFDWQKNNINLGVDFPLFFPKYPNSYYKEWKGWQFI